MDGMERLIVMRRAAWQPPVEEQAQVECPEQQRKWHRLEHYWVREGA